MGPGSNKGGGRQLISIPFAVHESRTATFRVKADEDRGRICKRVGTESLLTRALIGKKVGQLRHNNA